MGGINGIARGAGPKRTVGGLKAQRTAILREAERLGWGEATGSGRADALAVAKVERVQRAMLDVAALIDRSTRHGWALVALDVGGDAASLPGDAPVKVLATFARFKPGLPPERVGEVQAPGPAPGGSRGRPRAIPDEVVARIVAQRAAGRSLEKIADQLTVEQVPTAQGGVRWWASTVAKVLRSADLHGGRGSWPGRTETPAASAPVVRQPEPAPETAAAIPAPIPAPPAAVLAPAALAPAQDNRCAAERRTVEERCAVAARSREEAEAALLAQRDAERAWAEANARVEGAVEEADQRSAALAKRLAHQIFRGRRKSAASDGELRAATTEWLHEVDRINRAMRDGARVLARGRPQAAALRERLDLAVSHADSSRLSAEAAEEACLAARRALAACEQARP